jgi:hypothetical protein
VLCGQVAGDQVPGRDCRLDRSSDEWGEQQVRWSKILLIAVVPLLACIGCATPRGWTDGQRNAWYVADQGSRLIPQKWIDALEQPGGAPVGNGKFTDPAYLARFNYLLPAQYPRKNVDGTCPFDANLPIGFVSNCQDNSRLGVTKLSWLSKPHPTEPWVGMNCSACHTNAVELHFKDGKPEPDQTLIVDGAPTLADFQGFMAALEDALEQTLADDQKFARFAAAVLPASELEADKPNLRQAIKTLTDWNKKLAALNNDQDTPYGYGRLDAIGHIFNKVALVALPGGGQTSNPADAPVSYPFLWNVPQLDQVEWNGIAPNRPIGFLGTEDLGALARNTGEVTGVFADVTITPHAGKNGYVSSARIDRLDQMEQQLRSLSPPAWPARFGLNQTTDKSSPAYARSVTKGGALFADKCASCHTVPGGFHLFPQRFKTALTPLEGVQTDMWMACNASFDQAKAGAFAGDKQNLVIGDPIPDPASNLSMLQTTAVGTLLGQKQELAESVIKGLLGLDNGLPQAPPVKGYPGVDPKTLRQNQCLGVMRATTDPHYPQLVYKGRPLQGIWATAPYLHNGSVPTLYALLQAPGDRPTTFCVGSRKFDPTTVGFEYKDPCPAGTFKFVVSGKDGKPFGNSNAGHDYGNAGFSDDDRYALIEYMKTL